MEHRYALIAGIDYYNDTAHFIPLPFAQADAHALDELLIDPEHRSLKHEKAEQSCPVRAASMRP